MIVLLLFNSNINMYYGQNKTKSVLQPKFKPLPALSTMAKMLEALKKWYFLHKELKEWWNDSKQNPIMQINLKKISLLSIGVTYEVILSSYIFLMAHKILLQSIAN